MKKVAVVIKHPYRDGDVRVDIVEVPDDMHPFDVKVEIERAMLGPFEVLYVTEKVNLDRKLEIDEGYQTTQKSEGGVN